MCETHDYYEMLLAIYCMNFIVEIHMRADICFLIDSSHSKFTSVPWHWNYIKTLLKFGVGKFKIGSAGLRVALVSFSKTANVILKLNSENTVEGVSQRIDTLQYHGGSRRLAAGLFAVNHVVFRSVNGDRPDAPNIVILILSGRATGNSRYAETYAKEAKDNGVKIIGLGIDIFDIGELNTIASPPTSRTVFQVKELNEIKNIFFKALAETRRPVGKTTLFNYDILAR